MNPNVHYEFWVILYNINVGSLIITNVPFWSGMLMGGDCTICLEAGIWKLSVLSAQYCCELKTILKNSLFKRGKKISCEICCPDFGFRKRDPCRCAGTDARERTYAKGQRQGLRKQALNSWDSHEENKIFQSKNAEIQMVSFLIAVG